MLQLPKPENPISAERTPDAINFVEHLEVLSKEILLIELAVKNVSQHHDRAGCEAIIYGLRRLRPDVGQLQGMVMPPVPEVDQEELAQHLRELANENHAAALERIERVTGVKQSGAEIVAFSDLDTGGPAAA
jgi:hypothetical protein